MHFGYVEKEEVLKGISFQVQAGETIAIVGATGAGKSTIINLLSRFYEINSGEILIDGINLKDIKLKAYRQLFGLVTQDSILFNDSVFNNIALGDENPSKQRVIDAARVANAEEFILKLPNQYDDVIGEGGGKLSGGQKQRLSIARAVYKNPPIMVLDEATSALDTQSEKLVQDALNKMMENRTSLIIAHRLSTIMNADRIIVLEDGQIIESGNHEQLLDKNGMYAKLIQLQSIK